jgi:hypothetical protein
MGHTLTLEVPEDLYQPLAETARQTGRTPEELAAQMLSKAIREELDDPIEKFIGALRSQVPDWADQHDKYLRQTLMEEMQSQEEGK